MHGSFRLVRLGPLVINLSYTWLFALVLGLWATALLWIPDNFPKWDGLLYWLVGIAIMILFFVSTILHELVHSLVGTASVRSITLYPWGASRPFALQQITSGRSFATALAGPVFNLALGVGLVLSTGLLGGVEGLGGEVLIALATMVGWLNIAVGAVNFIPGVPFDGGWAISGLVFWFTGIRESSLKVAQNIGGAVIWIMVLVAAWRSLSGGAPLEVLALVLLAWAAGQAEKGEEEREVLQEVFQQIPAQDFMSAIDSEEAVRDTDTLAQMVLSHPRYAPDAPLPVVDENNELQGIVNLSSAEKFLQGVWSSIPVRSVMVKPEETLGIGPETSVTQVLAIAEDQEMASGSQAPVPVFDNGQLVGSVSLSRLEALELVDQEFGIEDAIPSHVRPAPAIGSRVRPVVLGLLMLVLLAIVGNIAVHNNPTLLRGQQTNTSGPIITFSEFSPADGGSITTGETVVTVQMVGVSALTAASIQVDGTVLSTTMGGRSATVQIASAQATNLAPGDHHVIVVGANRNGQIQTGEWHFKVEGTNNSTTQQQ